MSTAENQHEETTTPSDNLDEIKDATVRTTPTSPVWPRGVHSTIPQDAPESPLAKKKYMVKDLTEQEAGLQAQKMDEAHAPVQAQRNTDAV